MSDDGYEHAEAMEMADDRYTEATERIDTLERELEKADRRTAEQERIIAKQREKIEKLRLALGEALDDPGWPRIVELRKLTEEP